MHFNSNPNQEEQTVLNTKANRKLACALTYREYIVNNTSEVKEFYS